MPIRKLQTRLTLASIVLTLGTLVCGILGVYILHNLQQTLQQLPEVGLRTNLPRPEARTFIETLDRADAEARRGIGILSIVCALALGLSVILIAYVIWRVTGPIKSLSQFANALRFGDFGKRIEISTSDELGELANGLNLMAEAIAELQRFNFAQLIETKWTLEATLEALPDAIVLIDATEQVVSVNRVAREIFHLNGSNKNVALDDLSLPETVASAVRAATRGERRAALKFDLKDVLPIPMGDGIVKLLPLVIPVPHFKQDSCGVVLAMYDVTEFARLDELRMELIAVASHELKNPLTTVRMSVMMLRDSADSQPPAQREMIANAFAGCEELGKTIDELLDFTRADAGQLKLSLERLDISVVIDEAVRSFAGRFKDAGVLFEVRKDVSGAFCRVDSARLGMVMANLFANALKYTRSGGKVTVSLSSMQNAGVKYGPTLQIAVMDTGSGIPPELHDRIFAKFFRVEHVRESLGDSVRGTGVGLYLCKHIIEAHGGNIWCEAGENGVGTKIAFTLPGDGSTTAQSD